MKKYHVVIPWFASVTVTVEAKNKKDAIEKALENAYPSLCHQCARQIDIDGGADFESMTTRNVEEAK